MSIEVLKSGQLVCAVSKIEIFKLRRQPFDHVILVTNLPSPTRAVPGSLRVTVQCDRGLAEAWTKAMFPGVETHVYDHTLPVVEPVKARESVLARLL